MEHAKNTNHAKSTMGNAALSKSFRQSIWSNPLGLSVLWTVLVLGCFAIQLPQLPGQITITGAKPANIADTLLVMLTSSGARGDAARLTEVGCFGT